MIKRISHRWLTRHEACSDQVDIFDREWPDGADLTAQNIRRAAELHLDLHWLAIHILKAVAWRAYEEAKAPALITALGLEA